MGLSGRDRHDLPGKHLDDADRLLLLETGQQLGRAGAIIVGAVIPVTYLVLEKLPATARLRQGQIGPYYSGIAAFVGTALAMVIGSLLKPVGAQPIGLGTEQNGPGTEETPGNRTRKSPVGRPAGARRSAGCRR